MMSATATVNDAKDDARDLWWRDVRKQAATTSVRVLSLGLFLLVWGLFSLLPWAVRVPSPLDVLNAALGLDMAEFVKDMGLSTGRVVAGFLLAAALGIPLGILIGTSRVARSLLFTPIELLRPVPPIAWIPLAILFFPKIEWMIIFLTFYGAFFPIVYNTVSGVAEVRSTYIKGAKSLGASQWTMFWQVILPAALPVIFTGLYIAIGVAWLMVVAGEMIANKGGIGALTWQSYQTTNYPMIFVGMAAIGVLGYASSLIVSGISKLIVRWDP